MAQLRFDLRVYGGKADEAKVEASRLGRILEGIAADILDVCRNLSGEDQGTALSEKEAASRIYVIGAAAAGRSLTQTLATEESEIEAGVKSARAYIDGLRVIRGSSITSETNLPPGFDGGILKRVLMYQHWLGDDYKGMALDIHENGAIVPAVDFDARLATQTRLKLALMEARALAERPEQPDESLYGHMIEGVMFELSDPDYEDQKAPLRVELDPHDGKRWVCHIPREIVPENIEDLFRQRVSVEGTAKMRPKKPEIQVTKLSLSPKGDPAAALLRLSELGRGLLQGEELQTALDKLRERE